MRDCDREMLALLRSIDSRLGAVESMLRGQAVPGVVEEKKPAPDRYADYTVESRLPHGGGLYRKHYNVTRRDTGELIAHATANAAAAPRGIDARMDTAMRRIASVVESGGDQTNIDYIICKCCDPNDGVAVEVPRWEPEPCQPAE